MRANKRDAISTGIALERYLKHQLMDSPSSWFLEPGRRNAGRSLQMLDSLGLLLGQDFRREALFRMMVDLKIVPRPRALTRSA
ncbi:MAG TPA: hypothetical protein VKB84_02460 [Candidatus Binataceae bacterium]|nr:hypothetical protein [Candidatus Binataceae bacterium]